VLLAGVGACSSSESGASASGTAAASTSAAPKVVAAAEEPVGPVASSTAKAAEKPIVAIPAGSFPFGSTPGDRGRNAALEPIEVNVEVGAFDVDRLPYPNEEGKPPLLGASRGKAAELCKARGRRLCTELEWERACKGPAGEPYAGRAAWDTACLDRPSSCASGFGVLSMGAQREWTASSREAGEGKRQAIVRGAPASGAGDVERRCAARRSLEEGADGVAFRCCGGDASERAVEEPPVKPSFEKATLTTAELEQVFGLVPELAKLDRPLKFFDEETAKKEVVAKAKDGETAAKGYELVTSPLTWRPDRGEELVVVVGQAGPDAFIVALHRLPENAFRVASSLVLRKEPAPVVLAYDRSVGTRLAWATCFLCPAESGKISYRDDRRVIITQE
jgi:hypothetical protein